MAARATFLIVLAAFLSARIALADGRQPVPSNKASVVMPLLNGITANESPKSVLTQIDTILGKNVLISAGGAGGGHVDRRYVLDDKTEIVVVAFNDGRLDVWIDTPGQKQKVLYSASKS
jgi:hypothetical protein